MLLEKIKHPATSLAKKFDRFKCRFPWRRDFYKQVCQFHLDTLTLQLWLKLMTRVVAHGPLGLRKRGLTTLSSGALPNKPYLNHRSHQLASALALGASRTHGRGNNLKLTTIPTTSNSSSVQTRLVLFLMG